MPEGVLEPGERLHPEAGAAAAASTDPSQKIKKRKPWRVGVGKRCSDLMLLYQTTLLLKAKKDLT